MKKSIFILFFIVLAICYLSLYFIPIISPRLSTTYSNKFDLSVYNKIAVGETRQNVDLFLGKPLFTSQDNVNKDSLKINYWYSKSSSVLMQYDKVIIQFYDDKVINKIRTLDGD